MPRLLPGKLPADLLAHLLASLSHADPRLIVGPGVGLDVAVVALDDERCLVIKTDPITFATDEIGWYAVQICANDVATAAARPCWFLATLLLPDAEGNEQLARDILAQVGQACVERDVSLVGGHTEITYGLDRPIVCGTMLGEVRRDRLVSNAGARPGDAIVLTKGIAIEATALIAREKGDELSRPRPSWLARCRDFLTQPGLSVVRDAHVAARAGRVHAMHDPTEGGLANGLWEMAQASGTGLIVDEEAVWIYPETRRLCELTDLDAWGLIASGALLLAVEFADAEVIVHALETEGIRAAIIGQVTSAADGVKLRRAQGQGLADLPRFARDEIARLFG